MNTGAAAVLVLLSLAAPLAQGAAVGQCGGRGAMLTALASEGQRVVITAHENMKTAPPRLYIVRSKVDGSGYLLRQDRRRGVCIAGTLTQLRIGEPGGSARSDKRLVARNCSRSALNTRRNAALCASLQKGGEAMAGIDPDTFVDSGPAAVLAKGKGKRGIAPPQVWRAAQFGFCKVKDQDLVLCLSTYTAASDIGTVTEIAK